MDVNSIQRIQAQYTIYSAVGRARGDTSPGSGAASGQAQSAPCDFRSQDGDMATFSLQARELEATITLGGTDAPTAAGAPAGSPGGALQSWLQALQGAAGPGAPSAGGSDDPFQALLAALEGAAQGQAASGAASQAVADPGQAQAAPAANGKWGNPDPGHVAKHILRHLEREFRMTGGGSKADFAAEAEKRFQSNPGAGAAAQAQSGAQSDFMAQVNAMVAAGLDAWAREGEQGAAPASLG